MTSSPDDVVDGEEFDELFARCSTWGRWGADDRRGALNHITPDRRAAALALATEGHVVSCARELDRTLGPDNPAPAVQEMFRLPDHPVSDQDPTGVAMDRLDIACHGESHTHLDALCHIAYRGRLYNGVPASKVTADGAPELGLGVAATGIVARGVLLDVPRFRGVPWLEPGTLVDYGDLDAVDRLLGTSTGPGDVVLLRTGHSRRRRELGPWESASAKAGLHPRAMPWFLEHEVAALGFDGDGDSEPHPCPALAAPIHVLGINAGGLHFFDALDLDGLADACAARGVWSFLFVAAPLRADCATGCAINPLAIF
jgi:kynurenine formamidase